MSAPTTTRVVPLTTVDRRRSRLFGYIADAVASGLPTPSVGICDDADELRLLLPAGATGAVDAWAAHLQFPPPALSPLVQRIETGISVRPYRTEAGNWRSTLSAEICCSVRFGPAEQLRAGDLEPGDQLALAQSLRFADEVPVASIWQTVVRVVRHPLLPDVLPVRVVFGSGGQPTSYEPDEVLLCRRARVGAR